MIQLESTLFKNIWPYVSNVNAPKYFNLFIQTKYIIPEEGKTYTLGTINALWRLHKSRVKKEHYLKYDNDEERIKNKPSVVSAEEFSVRLKYWGDEEITVYTLINIK